MGNIIPTPISTITDVTQLNNRIQQIDDTYKRAVPLGTIFAFSGKATKIPQEYLWCNGQELNINEYRELFNIIGTIYGTGTGSQVNTHFKIPDLRNRFIYGTNDGQFNEKSGNANIKLESKHLPQHTHIIPKLTTKSDGAGHTHSASGITISGGAHSHNWNGYRNMAGGTTAQVRSREYIQSDPTDLVTNSGGGAHNHTVSGSVSGGAHTHTIDATNTGNITGTVSTTPEDINILPPYVKIAYIIKVKHINFVDLTSELQQKYMEQYTENYKIPQIRYYHKRENYKNSNINFIGI